MTDQSTDRRALLQEALRALDEMQANLDRVESAAHEPIAIVGMSCRFPGGANSPETYWDLLRDGRDVVTEYPDDRRQAAEAAGIDVESFADTTWRGGFLDQIDQFEPEFFGISPREADSMDPQQRLVLEVAWEALERAGIAPDSLGGSASGVFLGITGNDYVQLAKLGGPDGLDVYSATGGALNAAAGRVAYTLGLNGPCMAIDTACSSSLVALHQACTSLRNGETDMALAGGVNVVLVPETFICFTRWGMMAPDGRCKTFDAAADGFVRGEGCGVLVLKRERDAIADGDAILAVIRGSAVNQDGASSGLTVPNGPAQQAVLRAALAAARTAPADVQYFEAHGTGTELGDPIEVEALGAVLAEGRGDTPLTLGAVKTNLGHLESASGVAGVIKVVLAMQHGEIPPHLHLKERSPKIPWPAFPIEIPTELTPWPAVDGQRVAGVSGFGFSGTNAHVVLASPPSEPASESSADGSDDDEFLLPLSARTESALRAQAGRFADRLAADPDLPVRDVCATAGQGRAHLRQRVAVFATSRAQMLERLRAIAAGDQPAGAVFGRAGRPSVAFLFTGQGSQYAGMARRLYETEPVFREALDRVAGLIDPLLEGSLLAVMWAEEGSDESALLAQTGWTQPAVFAVEFALAELWRSFGVVPKVVLGHSVGELAAAVVAGVVSVEDAARLVVARGRLMQDLPEGGAMSAVLAPVEDVAPIVDADPGIVAVAAVNGPAHTVVSGESDAVARVAAVFADRGVRVQGLIVSHAFHSPLMEPMLDAFAEVARDIAYRRPGTAIVTNLGGRLAGDEIATADHWVRHVTAPVDFAAGVASMQDLGVDTMIEIGPHPVLLGMSQETLSPDAATAIPSLRRSCDDAEQVLLALGAYWAAGGAVDWSTVAHPDAHRAALPTYPFERQRHWLPSPRSSARTRTPGHPLLGAAARATSIGVSIFDAELASDWPPWVADHDIAGVVVLPGSAFMEMVLAATGDGAVVESLSIEDALVLREEGATKVQTTVVEQPDGALEVQVASSTTGSRAGDTWHRHARAVVRPLDGQRAAPEPLDLAMDDGEEVDVDAYYALMRSIGLTYGPTFRGLRRLWRRDGEALGRATLAAEVRDADRYGLHPALLDACFHVLGAAIADPDDAGEDVFVPVMVEGLRLFRAGASDVVCRVTLLGEMDAGRTVAGRVEIADADGAAVACIDRLVVRRMPRSAWAPSGAGPTYELTWRAEQRRDPAPDVASKSWLLFTDGSRTGDELAAGLTESGHRCTVVVPGASTAQIGQGRWSVEARDTTSVGALLEQLVDDDTDLLFAHGLDAAVDPRGGVDLEAVEPPLRTALAFLQAIPDRPTDGTRLWLVTRGAQSVDGEAASPAQATLWGVGRVAANELPSLRCRLIDVDPASDDVVGELLAELRAPTDEDQVALRGRARAVARLVPYRTDLHQPVTVPHEMLLAERGSIDALSFAPTTRRSPGPGEVEVEVRATGINFRDVLNVLGMYPGDPGPPGLECAGVVAALGDGVTGLAVGDAVTGIAQHAFDSSVVTDARLLTRVPVGVTFAQAATLPIAFLTAAYGLQELADLRAGERVLVHAAAGGVGMAAVQLAQRVGAEVYATAGSPEKRQVLERLGVRHIYDSRTLDFADEIMADTDGAGVDVVLNSLADDFIDAGFRVLAERGRFLEIGKRGIWSHEQVAAVRPRAAYHPYDLADYLQADLDHVQHTLRAIADDVAAGRAAPLPLRAFAAERVHDAFRFVAQARHIGKVVVTHRPQIDGGVRPEGTYLVTGGLGAIGLAVARRLVDRGARHLVLVGRSDASDDAVAAIAALERDGADVVVVQADVSREADVARVLDSVGEDAPLRGVYHAAGVVDDGALAQQTWERFEGVLAPKVAGAAVLDRATRSLDLDQFVLFSSASALLGAPGQSSYSAANSALDAIAHLRRAAGLPALSVNWGAWAGAGMAARLDERHRAQMSDRGFGELPPADALDALEMLVADAATHAAVMSVDWSALASDASSASISPMLSEVLLGSAPEGSPDVEPAERLPDVLAAAAPEDRRAVIDAYLEAQVVRVLRLDASQPVDPDEGLTEMGMDSLMAVELSNRMRPDTGLPIPSTLAFEYPTLREMGEYLAGELLADGADPTDHTVSSPDLPADADTDADDGLSDDEIVDKLLEELEDSGY